MPIIQSKMDGFSNMLKSNKKAKQADMLLRLEACSTKGANSRCAECPARNPKWASILVPPASATIMGSLTTDGKKNRKMTTGKRILGVFICQKCANFHLDMGRSVCAVKNTKAADQWTEEEVVIMEMSGNEVTNLIYEATIEPEEKEALNTVKDVNQQVEIRMQFVQKKYIDMAYFSEVNIRKYLQFRYAPKIYGTIPEFCQQARYDNMVARDPELQEQLRKQQEEEAAAAAQAASRASVRPSMTAALLQNALLGTKQGVGLQKLSDVSENHHHSSDPDSSEQDGHPPPKQQNMFADFSDPGAFDMSDSNVSNEGKDDEKQKKDDDDDDEEGKDADHRLDFLAQLGNKRRSARQRGRGAGAHNNHHENASVTDDVSLNSDSQSQASNGKPIYKGIAQELETAADPARRRRISDRRDQKDPLSTGDGGGGGSGGGEGGEADDFAKRARVRRSRSGSGASLRPSNSTGGLDAASKEGKPRRPPRRSKSEAGGDAEASGVPRSRHRRGHEEDEASAAEESQQPQAISRINRKPLRRSKSAVDEPMPTKGRPRRAKSDDGGLVVQSAHVSRGGRRPRRTSASEDSLGYEDPDADENLEDLGAGERRGSLTAAENRRGSLSSEHRRGSLSSENRGGMERNSIAGRRQQMEHRQKSRRSLTADPNRRLSRRNLMAELEDEPPPADVEDEESPKNDASKRPQLMKKGASRRSLLATDISRRQSKRMLMVNMDDDDDEEHVEDKEENLDRRSKVNSRLAAAESLGRTGHSTESGDGLDRRSSKVSSRLSAAESLGKSGHKDTLDGIERRSKAMSRLAAAEGLGTKSGHGPDLGDALNKYATRLAAAEGLNRIGGSMEHKSSHGSRSGGAGESAAEKRDSMLALAQRTRMLAKQAKSEQQGIESEVAVLSGAASGDDTMYNTAAELRAQMKAMSLHQ